MKKMSEVWLIGNGKVLNEYVPIKLVFKDGRQVTLKFPSIHSVVNFLRAADLKIKLICLIS